MKVAFRADASLQIGTGHVMRCLTLAEELRSRGAVCHFICRAHPGNLTALLRQRGFDVTELPGGSPGFTPIKDEGAPPTAHAQWLGCDWHSDVEQTLDVVQAIRPDWMVVDHYAIDIRWEKILRPHVRRMMVIDDLADRAHVCDLLLDQNFYADMATRYIGLTPETCTMFLGPTHVLLRPEFIQAKQHLRQRDGVVRHILVFFGGSDPTNQTRNVLVALGKLNRQEIAVDVVIGGANPHRSHLQELCKSMPNVALHYQVSNMAELIGRADLGIGAGGAAMWERCYLGLPTITVAFADNQVRTTEDVARLGAIKYLGRCNSFSSSEYELAINEVFDSPEQLKRMSEVSQTLVCPGTQQIADVIEGFSSAFNIPL